MSESPHSTCPPADHHFLSLSNANEMTDCLDDWPFHVWTFSGKTVWLKSIEINKPAGVRVPISSSSSNHFLFSPYPTTPVRKKWQMLLKKDSKLIKYIFLFFTCKEESAVCDFFFIKYISHPRVALRLMNFAALLCHSLRPHKIVFNDLLNIHFQWMQ